MSEMPKTYIRKPNIECSLCQTLFYKKPHEIAQSKSGNVFCSKKCYGLYTRKELPCLICGKMILASKHALTCSRVCANISRTGMSYHKGIGPPGGYKKDKARTNAALKTWLLTERANECQGCGYDKFIVVHHIVERSKGGSNESSNLLLACSNCHTEIHHQISGPALDLQNKLLGK